MRLVPYRSCGDFHAGLTYDEIRNRFPDHDEFLKSAFSRHVTSVVLNRTVHVSYSDDGRCVGVEVMKPTCPEWEGVRLGNRGAQGLISDLKQKQIEYREDVYGIDCKPLGFATFAPHHIVGEDVLIDAVYVTFESDFFDTAA